MKKLIAVCILLMLVLASCTTSQRPNPMGSSSVQSKPELSSAETTNTTGDAPYTISNSYIAITNTAAKYFIQTYTLIDNSHKNSKVSIRFPQLVMGDDAINKLIENYAIHFAENGYGKDYANLSLDVDYHITYNDDEWISISFNGFGNVKTAPHPNNILTTLNINLKNGSTLKLSDIYTIDKSFVQIYRKEFAKQMAYRFGVADTTANEAARNYLDQYDDKTLTGYLNDSYCYMTCDKIGISFETIFAMGNHFEPEIPYSDLLPYLKLHTAPFSKPGFGTMVGW